MKPSIKAVFFDIDSTLYYHGIHDVVPSAQQALWKLQKQGIKVGIATSRCHKEMANVPLFFHSFPFSAIVSDGGALVMEQETIVKAQRIDPVMVEKIVAFAQSHHITMKYSTVEGNYFLTMPKQKEKDAAFRLYLNLPQIQPYEHDDVLNIIIHVETEQNRDELWKLLDDRLSIVNYQTVLECNPAGIDKSVGIQALADRWQLSVSEIMCFGDGSNDVKMLSSCGIGIAMGNGCDAVKAAADFVTKPIEQDGIAYALEKYGLI